MCTSLMGGLDHKIHDIHQRVAIAFTAARRSSASSTRSRPAAGPICPSSATPSGDYTRDYVLGRRRRHAGVQRRSRRRDGVDPALLERRDHRSRWPTPVRTHEAPCEIGPAVARARHRPEGRGTDWYPSLDLLDCGRIERPYRLAQRSAPGPSAGAALADSRGGGVGQRADVGDDRVAVRAVARRRADRSPPASRRGAPASCRSSRRRCAPRRRRRARRSGPSAPACPSRRSRCPRSGGLRSCPCRSSPPRVGRGHRPAATRGCRERRRRSWRHRPTGPTVRPSNTRPRSPGDRPIIVRPAVSNEHVAVYGMPTSIAAVAAARTSSGADIVSIHATSAPPATRPSICSRNAATAASWVSAAERREQLPGRTDRAGDDDRAVRRVGHRPGDRRRRLGQLEHPVLGAVQRQPVAVAAERVGEDDVGAGVDESADAARDRSRGDRRSTTRVARRTRGPSGSSWSRSPRRRGARRGSASSDSSELRTERQPRAARVCVAVPRNRRHVAVETLDLVEAAHLVEEDVDDDVAVVDQHPLLLALTLDPQRRPPGASRTPASTSSTSVRTSRRLGASTTTK